MSGIVSLHCAVDCIYEIVGFLTIVECCNFSMTGKVFKKILDSEKIWDYFIQNRISGINMDFKNNHLSINLLKDALGYRRAKDFYSSFRRLEFHILGWFHALPPFNNGGGLFRGTYVDNELLYQFVDTDGELVHGKSFKIRYDDDSGNLIAQSLSRNGTTYLVELGKKIIFHSTKSIILHNIIFVPIPAKEVSTNILGNIANRDPDFSILESILGLNTSRFNMGCVLEILNISINDELIRTWMPPTTVPEINFGQLQLHGLKITGDVYVPSGEVSFCINLDREVDPQTRLIWRHRRIIYYPNAPYRRENFSVEDRLDNIAAWYPGYMQIAFPGFQNPSWVPCQFIMYRTPLANGGRFNIVWDDRLESTEFRPLFQGHESELRFTSTTIETEPTTAALPLQPNEESFITTTTTSTTTSLLPTNATTADIDAAVTQHDSSFFDLHEEEDASPVVYRKEFRTIGELSAAELASARRMLSCGRTWFSREYATLESFFEQCVSDRLLHFDAVDFQNVHYEAVYSYSDQGGNFVLEGVMLRWGQDGPVDVGYMHDDFTDFDESLLPLTVRELLWGYS